MAGEDKTEKATPKRRSDERKKGNIFQSKDIVTVGSIAVAFYTLSLWMPYIYKFTSDSMKKYIGMMATTTVVDTAFFINFLIDMLKVVLMCAGILMVLLMITGIVLAGAQTKFLITRENIKFKFSKLNPLSGLKNMVSMRAFVEVLKNLVKITIIGVVVYSVIVGNLNTIPQLMGYDIMAAIGFVFKVIMDVVNGVIIYFLAISVVDYIYQWWSYEKKIMMSKQEVKDEYKNIEGNPEVKGKRKERQRKMAMMRMMQQVPTADVIIRNPTHFAVAIKYDEKGDFAPVVVAKGQDYVALKIVQKGMEANVHIIENKPLARALYAKVELNREIPYEFYEPVAEVLAWVYKLKNKIS